jgi:perosamine synthetase
MVLTNDEALAERMRLLRSQAFEHPRFVHRFLGYNYRLTNLQAAIGLAQTEMAEQKATRRREIAALYTGLLADLPGLTLPYEAPWAKSTYWMYGVLVEADKFGRDKAEVVRELNAAGVDTRDFFYPMHQQPLFTQNHDPRYPDVSGAYPVSRDLYERGFYLPSGLGLTSEQIEIVVDELRKLQR